MSRPGTPRRASNPFLLKPRDARVWCPRCGWTFTVHDVPAAPEYAKPNEWFCPHCGKPTTEQPRVGKPDGPR